MTTRDASVTPSQSVLIECDLPEPPEKVWRALTVPEILAAWMMPNDIRPEAGSRFSFDKAPGMPGIDCEILDAEPGQLLRYSWRERNAHDDTASQQGINSTVTFVLARTASGGTHLRIVHTGFAAAARQPASLSGITNCRLAMGAPVNRDRKQAIPANAPRLVSRAA